MTTSKRTSQLQKLKGKMPVANQQLATNLQAARDIQLQGAVRAQPQQQAQVPTQQAAANIGAQQAQQQGQQQIQQAQQSAQIDTNIANQQLQEQQRQAQKKQFEANVRNRQRKLDIGKILSRFGHEVKDEILDSRLQFAEDEAGRSFMNKRQLLDFAMVQTRNEEDWQSYKQEREHAYQVKIQVYETAHKKIMQQLEHEFTKGEHERDQALEKRLTEAKISIEDKISKEQAEAANEAGMWQAGGSIVGGVVGGIYGGPAGASLGASVGGGLGSMAGSAVSD